MSTPFEEQEQDDLLLSRGIVRTPTGGYMRVPYTSIQYWRNDPIEAPQAPQAPVGPEPEEGVGFADYARSIMAGGAQLVQGVGWLTRQAGLNDVGRAIEELGSNAVDYWHEGLSDAAKDALAREFIHKNELGEWEWGDANLHTVGLFGAQSLLGTASGAGVGAGITKVLQVFANPVGRSALTQAVQKGSAALKAAQAGDEAAMAVVRTGQAAAKKLALVDKVIGATGFGVGEGTVGGMSAGVNVYERVLSLPAEKLASNPRYQEVFNSTDESMPYLERHQYAAETVAREASSLAGFQSGLTTSLLGAPMGAFFGAILGRRALGALAGSVPRAATTGAAGEAAQEFAQSAAEAVISNRALQRAGDDEVELFEGVLNEAIGGALAGAPIGGAFGATQVERQQPAKQSQKKGQTKPGQPAPKLEPLRTAAREAFAAGVPREEILETIDRVKRGEEPVLVAVGNLRKRQMGFVSPSGEAPQEQPKPTAPPTREAQAAQPAPEPAPQQNRSEPAPAPGRTLPQAVAVGAETTVAGEKPIRAQYQLADVNTLVTSHDIEGRANEAFPQELQPRDRSRSASRQWIEETTARFQHEPMIEGVEAGSGPPIVDADGIVESGNGRTNLLRNVYAKNKAKGKAYKAYLKAHAERFGIDPAAVDKVETPILVRVRQDPMDISERVAFTQAANRPSVAALSPAERARADAVNISDDQLARLNVPEDGNVLAASNADFVQSFLQSLPATERGGLITAEGEPTKQVADRIKAALFAKAYDDDRLLALMAEEADPDVANVVNALVRAAPAFARVSDAGFDITGPLIEGVEVLRAARRAGQSVDEYLRQQGLFSNVSPEAGRVASFLSKNIRSAKRMSEALVEVARYAEQASNPTGDLIGQPLPRTLEAALNAANQRMQERYPERRAQGALFARPAGQSVTDQIPEAELFGGNPDLPPAQEGAPDFGRPSAPAGTVRNAIPSQLSQRQKAQLLAEMAQENVPIAQGMMERVLARIGGRGNFKVNTKSEKSLLGKSNRPSILAKRPWWNVEYVADSFRFKLALDNWNDLPTVLEALNEEVRAAGAIVEKADFSKFWSERGLGTQPTIDQSTVDLAPVDLWGWRTVPIDLRMPNGQIAEFYVTLREMNEAQEEKGHDLFEKWRFRDAKQLLRNNGEELRRFLFDARVSRENYDNAVRRYLQRTNQTPSELLASFRAAETAASSEMGAKSFVRSSIVEPSGSMASRSVDQSPPSPRQATRSGDTSNVTPLPSLDLSNIEPSVTGTPPSVASLTDDRFGVMSLRRILKPAIDELSPIINVTVEQSPMTYGLDARVQGAFLTRASGRQEVVLFAQPIGMMLTGAPNAFARAREILTHEVFGHFALERTPWGREAVDMVLQLHDRQHASIEPLWEEVKKRYGYITREEHAKEVIALMAERGIKHATMTRLMAAVRRFLRSLGIVRNYSDSEVRDLILRAARALRTDVNAALANAEKLNAVTPQSSDAEILAAIDEAIPPGTVDIDSYLGSKVFHGSPHDFDEFSLQNIGAGEGAQAYGWGLYFAENPEVAGTYRRGLGSALAFLGRPISFVQPEQVQWMSDTQRRALALLRDEANIADARRAIESGAYADRVAPEVVAEVQRLLDSGDVTERPRGPLYTVEIPDEEVAKFLDRDASFSEQPRAVREALARMHPDIWGEQAEDFDLDPSEPGEMIYERLADLHGGPQGASLALAAEGIKGLKYLDEGSRQLGDKIEQMIREHGGVEQAKDFARSMMAQAERQYGRGSIHARGWRENLQQLSRGVTRNLVVFDDSILKVKDKVLAARAAPADPDIQEIMDRVLSKAPEEFTLRDKVRKLWSDVRNTQGLAVKQGLIDQFASIEALEREFTGGALLDASESAYKAALATKNLSSVMAATMMVGVPEYKNGAYVPVAGRKGVIDIFKPLTEHKDGNLLRQWELFAAANRANRLIKEKNKDGTRRENLFTQEEIDKALSLEQKYPVFRQVLNDWNEFNKQMLDLAQDAGVLDPAARAVWEKNDYVPFYRAMEDVQQAPRTKKGLQGQRAKIGTLKGGTEQLGNIFENMMLNTAHLLDASFKNRAMQRIVGLGIGTALEPVPFDVEAIKFTDDQLARSLTNAGLIVGNLETGLGGLQVVKQMTPEQKAHWSTLFRRVAPKGKNIVSVMVNGKPEYYEVTDPLLFSSITGMGHDNFADVWGLFRGSKRLLTSAVTADPAFMLANFVRDTLSTWVVSDASMHPFVDAVKGAKAALTNDPALIEIMMAGAGGGGYYDSAPEDVRKMIASKVPAGAAKGVTDTVINTPRKAWRAWQKIGSAAENANRVAIFKAVVANGGTKAEAAYQARDVLNFTMSGDYAAMRWLTQTVPFMNARIQGLYRLYRGARDNKRAFAIKGFMLLAATMALALKNNDDERYEELPEWDKDTYWHIFAGDEHFRIPKPFEVGAMFATIPERIFRAGSGRDSHKILGQRMMQMFADTFAFNPVPQLVKPVIEQYANRSMFTGSPIVGMAEQRLQPEAQFTPWTSATMRELADAMPDFAPAWLRSPRRLEAALRAYTGTLGMYILGASDSIVRNALGYPEQPEKKVYDLPVVSRFLKDPNPRHTKYTDLMYDMLDETNAIYSTINRLRRERRFEQARELQQANKSKLAVRVRLNRIATNVRNINAQIRLIQHSKTLNPTQKRERIDGLVERKNKLTRQVERFTDLF